jgi:hypothetical protein
LRLPINVYSFVVQVDHLLHTRVVMTRFLRSPSVPRLGGYVDRYNTISSLRIVSSVSFGDKLVLRLGRVEVTAGVSHDHV